MPNTSFYKMAEQVLSAGGKGELQELIEAVRQSYGTAIRMLWYENKKNDLGELDGSSVFTFKNIDQQLDPDTLMYYIPLPSASVALPHEMGIVTVCFMQSQTRPFVRIASGALALWAGVRAWAMGANQVYFQDGKNLVFPKMKAIDSTAKILLKLAVGVDLVEADELINIPLNVQDQIVNMVLQKFNPKPPGDQTLNNG